VTDGDPHPRWRLRLWPRGVRARLVAVYLLAAAVLALAGALVLTITLANGLRANVDAGLHTRADALAADVAAGNIERTDPGPSVTARARGEDVTTFTAVLDPSGTLVDAQPIRLPASPLVVRPASDPVLTSTRYAGIAFRILTIPVHRSDGTWHIVAGQSLEAANEANSQVRRAVLIATPILLLLVGFGAWLLSGSALKPVERMRADAQRLSEHDGKGRLSEPGTADSLARLARTFNQLLDRLHNSLYRQRGLVADAGHELRTPLAVLQTELETAVRPGRTRADLIDSISHAHLEVQRLSALSEDLLLLAQTDSSVGVLAAELTDIGALLDDTVAAHHAVASARSVSLHAAHPPALLAEADPAAIRRVLDNLVVNALRHARGHVWLEADRESPPSTADVVMLRVRDDGPGFPPNFLPHAFDRFTRADEHRSRADPTTGTGLGLAIVRSLITAHRGTVTAANVPDGGAEVTIRIPGTQE
jgi:two-component system OmpR family sensor kinase